MNTELRKQAKNDFEKDFHKLMNNAVFGKTMANVRKHRDIKLVTTDKKRNQLVSEPNYHTTKWFSEKLLAIETKKTKVKMNKPVYLGLSILEISLRVACYIRADLCFNRRNVFSNTIEHVFFDLLIPKVKPISIDIFYRPPNANTFLETF